jgi:hypothetical protein
MRRPLRVLSRAVRYLTRVGSWSAGRAGGGLPVKKLLVAASLVASVAIASSAHAATMLGTVTGIIANGGTGVSGYDFAGDFGTPGTLVGKAFTLSFTF